MRRLDASIAWFLVSAGAFTACGSDDVGGGGSGGGGTDAGADVGSDTGPEGAAGSVADAPPEAPDSASPVFLPPPTGLAPPELGVLVNQADPQSVEVADYYVTARGIPAANVVALSFPVNDVMTEPDFAAAKAAVDAALPPGVQALAITWTRPYRVECMSVTSAFALGFDTKYCNTTGGGCGPTASVETYDSGSLAPFTDHGIRPAMMLAAKDAAGAKLLIDRGVAADRTFPTGDGYFVRTTDTARSVRFPWFVAVDQDWDHPEGLNLIYVDNSSGAGSDTVQDTTDVLFYLTGLADVPGIATNTYRPGAIADHLTSYGGQVPASGQMSVVAWLEAGATASYGTVVEPCNYTSKFPDPRVILPWYYRGSTLLEAYWKSVLTPGEGLFVGEPLARPWGTLDATVTGAKLVVHTTSLEPGKSWALEAGDAESGPFSPVKTGIVIDHHQLAEITFEPATAAFYRLVPEG